MAFPSEPWRGTETLRDQVLPTNHQRRSCYNLLSAGQVLSSAHELWVSLPSSLGRRFGLLMSMLYFSLPFISVHSHGARNNEQSWVFQAKRLHTKLWRWENTKFIQRTSVLALVPGTEDAGAKTICSSSSLRVWREEAKFAQEATEGMKGQGRGRLS